MRVVTGLMKRMGKLEVCTFGESLGPYANSGRPTEAWPP
jgi:hypothetical protein